MMNSYSILCVDDEPTLLSTQSAVLRHGGFNVYTAANLAEARAILSEKQVDGVVLDASVCNAEGICMFEALRKIQPRVTFVLHTGNPETLQLECVQDKKTIAKPVPPNELAGRLKRILDAERDKAG